MRVVWQAGRERNVVLEIEQMRGGGRRATFETGPG